jgi:hypothetical protein
VGHFLLGGFRCAAGKRNDPVLLALRGGSTNEHHSPQRAKRGTAATKLNMESKNFLSEMRNLDG